MRPILVFLASFVLTLAACSSCAAIKADEKPRDEMMVRPGGDVLPAKFLGGPPNRESLFVCAFVDNPGTLECVSAEVYAKYQAEKRKAQEAAERSKGEEL